LKTLNNTPKVSVVILNWNGKNYLQQFLPSVLKSTYSNIEIIIADNGSTDDSVSFLQQNFPQVKIILLDKNYGFARGYNEALKKITSEYYILLNSDVEVTPNWIAPMVTLLQKDESIAACQPKILSYQNKKVFDYAGSAGGWIDKYGYPFAKGRIFDICEEDRGQYDQEELIFWASGAAMFIRSNVFHEMGGFDPYFFAHQEEIDLCWRLQLAGYKIYSCPSSTVYHVGGGTLPRGNSRKTFLNFRNNLVMLYKNLPAGQRWWKLIYRIILDSVSALKGLLMGDGGYFLAITKAHLAFVKWILFKQGESIFPVKKTGELKGLYHHNLVWDYFVKGKKYFSEIIK
jgi:GT2 family glycosyltransferase